MAAATRVIGLTLGDSAGIGPEVIDAALASGKLPDGFAYHIIGARVGMAGQPNDASARAALAALEEAAALTRSGEIHAVVTGPVAKSRLQAIGWSRFCG